VVGEDLAAVAVEQPSQGRTAGPGDGVGGGERAEHVVPRRRCDAVVAERLGDVVMDVTAAQPVAVAGAHRWAAAGTHSSTRCAARKASRRASRRRFRRVVRTMFSV